MKQKIELLINDKKRVFLMLLAVVFLLYFNTLFNGYSIDDEIVIQHNEWVKSGLSGVYDIFTNHYDTGGNQGYEYRPITLLTFALEYHFFGENPFISHFISLLLYVLLCYQLYLLFLQMKLDKQPLLLGLTLLLFLIHPIHTEVLNNIKSRDELLSILFGLLCLRYVLKFTDKNKWKYLFLAFIFIVIASLSKISAVIFVGIAPLILYFFRTTNWKQIISIPVLLFLGALTYVLISSFIIAEQDTQLIRTFEFYENPLIEASYAERIPAAIYLFGYQSSLLLFPFPLSFYYGYDFIKITTWLDWLTYVNLIVLVTLVYVCIKGLSKKRFISFFLLFYFVSIFPYLNYIALSPGIVAERFLFLASIPFCLGIAWSLLQLKNKIILYALIGIITVVSTGWTWKRNTHWKDTLTLVENDLEHLQRSFKANIYYATKLVEQEKSKKTPSNYNFKKAAQHYLKALEIYPHSSTTHNNLGVVYLNHLNEPKLARNQFEQAISIDSSNNDALLNLAAAYKYQNDEKMVIQTMDRLLSSSPDFFKAYQPYIQYLTDESRYYKALEVVNQAVHYFPEESLFYLLRGDIFGYLRDIKKALENYEINYKLNPTDEMNEHIQYLKEKLDLQN